MLFQSTLYGSAICLLLVLLQVAGIFYALGAQMIAWMQVLIYAGAIMVLVVIAVMAAPPKLARLWAGFRAPPAVAAVVPALLLAELLVIGLKGGPSLPARPAPGEPAALESEASAAMFGRYAAVTEAVGLLILVASLAVVPEAAPPPDA